MKPTIEELENDVKQVKCGSTLEYPQHIKDCPAMHPELQWLHDAGWKLFFAPDGEITGTCTRAFDARDLPLSDCIKIQHIIDEWGKK